MRVMYDTASDGLTLMEVAYATVTRDDNGNVVLCLDDVYYDGCWLHVEGIDENVARQLQMELFTTGMLDVSDYTVTEHGWDKSDEVHIYDNDGLPVHG